jgi:hypothetical protein
MSSGETSDADDEDDDDADDGKDDEGCRKLWLLTETISMRLTMDRTQITYPSIRVLLIPYLPVRESDETTDADSSSDIDPLRDGTRDGL